MASSAGSEALSDGIACGPESTSPNGSHLLVTTKGTRKELHLLGSKHFSSQSRGRLRSQDPKMLARNVTCSLQDFHVGSSVGSENLQTAQVAIAKRQQKASLAGPEDAGEEHHV
ncbi:hypothetical protein TruAng_011417 [Truncatella angustata]|nr:hypothetical protein TruAng_011417 [Truncatella angustata]